jgi:hypothetical protein
MLKNIHLTTKNGSNVWFCSDTHFGHDKEFIIKPRGFNSIQEHDAAIIKAWNERVKPSDAVVFLGDFSLRSSVERTKELLNLLHGTIYYIWGNHESYATRIYKEELNKEFGHANFEIYPLKWNNKVVFLGSVANVVVDGQFIVCSHFPFRIWEHCHHGSWNLSGHSHSNDKERNPDHTEGKCLDCGIDNFSGPISFAEVSEKLKNRTVVALDHHNRKTT